MLNLLKKSGKVIVRELAIAFFFASLLVLLVNFTLKDKIATYINLFNKVAIKSTTKTSSDLSNIKILENDILELDKKLKPLQSSYTQTQSGGAPTKKDSEKAERTLDREKTAEGGGKE